MNFSDHDTLTNALGRAEAINAAIQASTDAAVPMNDEQIAYLTLMQFDVLQEAREVVSRVKITKRAQS